MTGTPAPALALPLALTMGDPAGIGAEIALAAWASGRVARPFFLIGDPDRLAPLADRARVPVATITGPEAATAVFGRALPVLALTLPAPMVPGQPDPANAPAVVAAIERAVALVRGQAAAAVVTNPINKKALHDGAGFEFPGHTEFLAHLDAGSGAARRPVMMLVSRALGLRVVPVTIHIALAEVPGALTAALIEETARIVAEALSRDFGIARPRLAVAGLNPHAGEQGAIGREEIEVIAPALERLRAGGREGGLEIAGPLAADTMFHAEARARYDAALTMYHDQGLIALKALDFARGVNVTLGLGFVRTSPDHGTAYDIAGTGRADPGSLIEALNLAAAMADRRVGRRAGQAA
ncbi:MAG: 4-hydroxythreonine-4-phosphate dehydrogenase PdxA [Proteobacteria bacterium]|nr:4-hydroxythreonine-4-phosphate dehydrogenase PdxA [Pseudomonadota bacterium]